ncbi:hypothetical protein CJ739_2514 [Mariniflexile rhizosphaerae]|nr:hypothetical protein CJ739_2514 [Mariniflexile sp. TRM1-10]
MNFITQFYDKLFLRFYKLGKPGGEPKVLAMILTSTIQATNILLILTFLVFIFDIEYLIDKLPLTSILMFGGSIIFNFYRYQINGQTEILIEKGIEIKNITILLSIIFLFISMVFPLIMIYLFNEVF